MPIIRRAAYLGNESARSALQEPTPNRHQGRLSSGRPLARSLAIVSGLPIIREQQTQFTPMPFATADLWSYSYRRCTRIMVSSRPLMTGKSGSLCASRMLKQTFRLFSLRSRGSPPNDNRNDRRDCKDEQGNWSLILDGVARLTDPDPHIDQRGD
jgi:hypothetical protein